MSARSRPAADCARDGDVEQKRQRHRPSEVRQPTSTPARQAASREPSLTADYFARRVLGWFDRCGRHDLPWQRNRTPYAVWLSEIMLQQTQVATVIPYFERFVARFPGVGALAAADLDHVLALWSGLGYYARARNLHRAAGIVMERHAGELPQAIEELVALPGIGRSTAGAILAQAHGLRHPILDGNVKRVLARHLALEGWPGERDVERQLWECAERHTPVDRVADYTQAVMDLGATLCVRSRPACTVCPVAEDCRACRLGIQARLPAARPKRVRPRRSIAVLVIQDPQRSVLLERRPQRGVWGGLFSFPELGDGDDAQAWCLRRLGVAAAHEQPLAPIEHAFTHFDLSLEPLLLRLDTDCAAVMDAENLLWYKPAAPSSVGIAAPINALLESLERPDADQEGANRKTMSRTVHCVVLGAESEGLDRPPYPGELGRRIYDNVSKLAWQRWLGHQTMLINEYRLSPIEPKARQFLEREMEKFFFGEGSEKPPEFQET